MASYKDILNGTLRGLGDKVKEVSEAGGVKEIYTRGAERAKSYARAAKLSLEINGDSEELRKVYAEIGKLYFEQNEAAPGALYAGLFAQAEEIRARVGQIQRQILQNVDDDLEELALSVVLLNAHALCQALQVRDLFRCSHIPVLLG